MSKRGKQQPQMPVGDGSYDALAKRVAHLEKIVSKHFGAGIDTLMEGAEDDPVVDEKRYERSVIRRHRSGAIEYVRICEWCQAEVSDLAMHRAVCPRRPMY